MTRPKRNVVKFPKPCRPRKPGPPFGLTLEQLMQGRDVLKRVLAEYEAECDLLVKIPMAGRADSLNAAMATAVMAFAIRASWR